MRIYLNKVVLKTRFDHALDVVDKLEQDDLSQSGIAWLWCNLNQESHKSDERMRTKIHIFTKECLLGTMIIIEINTLFRDYGVEWARVL